MKKVFKPMLVLAFIILVSYNVYSSQQEVTVSDLALSNAEALATGEESSNYGPADQVKCAGGLHKKNCLCKPGYPACTETKCY